ncbi:MAG: hypothetical protein LBB41_00055 [Prevotellaceae bacterium]|nr:hypothetical protein [Prevotellaceae bacterium]
MALVSMSSCDKKDEPGSDDPTVDNPTVSSINININTSSADVAKAELLNTSGDLAAEIATATYQNNKFVLNLPAELDASMLSNVELGINDSRVSVSNPQAKVAVMQVAAYKNDILVGYLVMTEITQNGGKEQAFMYSDRDVSITGDYSDNYDGIVFRQIYEMHLKKGWNRYYVIVNNTISPTGFTQTVRMTTSAQAGLAWEIVPNRTNLPLLTK